MKILRNVVIPIWIACLPLMSRAADVQVTTSTQNPWYRDYLSDPDKAYGNLAQYFRLSASRLDDEGKLNVYGYGRFIGQLTQGFESRPGPSNDVVGRLYYFYLDGRDVIRDHLDVQAGRTYVPAAALAGTVDGGRLNLKNLVSGDAGGVGVTAFGGRRVTFYNLSETGGGDDALWGGSVYFDTIKYTHFELSYAQKYGGGDLAQENFAAEISTTPFEAVNVVARGKFDAVSSRASELLFGVNLSPFSDLTLRGEFYSSYPTFDKFSFYRFFGVNQYRQLSVGAEYLLLGAYRLSARYANENFNANATADLFEAGLTVRAIRNLTVSALYEARSGYAGRLGGLRLNGAYRLYKATLLAGVDYDDFRRDASRDGSAKKYWAGLGYDFTPKLSASVRVEDNINFYQDNLFQGFLAFNFNL